MHPWTDNNIDPFEMMRHINIASMQATGKPANFWLTTETYDLLSRAAANGFEIIYGYIPTTLQAIQMRNFIEDRIGGGHINISDGEWMGCAYLVATSQELSYMHRWKFVSNHPNPMLKI